MSAVAPFVAGAIQYTPSQSLPPQTPSQSSLNGYPSTMHALSSDSMDVGPLLHTSSQNPVMIQAQAQAQQLFRQRQLMAYQQQQQFRLQQQQQQQSQPPLSLQQKQPPLQVVQTPPTPQESRSRIPATDQQKKDPEENSVDPQPPPPPPPPPLPSAELTTKASGLTPIQTNDVILSTITPTTTPTLKPGSSKTIKRPGLNKMYHSKRSTGHAVLRLLQFAEQLDPGDQALQRAFWDGFIADFFTKSSKTKLGLRNSDTDEQRAFYISHYSVAKFFHTLYECGVSSIQLTLEQTMEFILPGGHMNVECPRANFIYRYRNGSLVSSTGHLWVRFSLTPDRVWKIKHFEFACQRNEEFVSRSCLVLNKDGSKLKKSSKNNPFPESPINAWGIPPMAFHILQMMDAAVQLDDIIFYSLVAKTTAKDSLAGLAFKMEQQQSKDAIMTNNTALDTPDPPASPGEPNVFTSSSPPPLPPPPTPSNTSSKTKTNKKSSATTRRKSLKSGKSTKQEKEDGVDQSEQQQTPTTTTTTNMMMMMQNDNFGIGTANTPVSPIVKTQSGYPSQQQQFFQQQRKILLEQQAFHRQQEQQHQTQLFQHQDQQQQQFLSMGHTSSPLPSGLTPAYQQQQQQQPSSTESLNQPISYLPPAHQPQQQAHELDNLNQSPKKQFRKRSDTISENKKSPASRKKGKTNTLK